MKIINLYYLIGSDTVWVDDESVGTPHNKIFFGFGLRNNKIFFMLFQVENLEVLIRNN